MATAPQAPARVTGGPAEPVPVAVLARTSTLVLQDPAASLRRQITSSHECLPPGFYVAGYYWDVESGGLDIEQRGHGSYEQFTAQGIPRDGGLADLLTEARSPQPRFGAVVCENIERASRDTCNSLTRNWASARRAPVSEPWPVMSVRDRVRRYVSGVEERAGYAGDQVATAP